MQRKERVVFIDWLRFIACFMVMIVHSCEPFYLGGEGTMILNRTNALLVTLIDSFLRPCVPLFVMASSYLLFPVKGDVGAFYRRRLLRVGVPLIVWVLLYTVVPLYGSTYEFYKGGAAWGSLLNFPGPAGHLWFVYMIIGIYIVMPIFSPWIEKAGKKGEQAFLALWLFTTLVPFLRLAAAGLDGASGIWGEANWNEFGLLYGVSGFMGYVVLGHYFRTHVGELGWKKTLGVALPMMLAGYGISAGWFWTAMPKEFPVNASLDLAVYMETSWGFCTIGTALNTTGMFMIIRKLHSSGGFYQRVVLPVSEVSYGMYLMHIFFLCFYTAVFQQSITSTLVTITLTAVCTFVTSFIVARLLSRIPKIGKYIVG